MSRLGTFICALTLATLASRPLQAANAGEEFFESKVRPVLAENCYKCHSAASQKLKANLLLDSRAGMLKGGESGEPAVAPGKPDDSRLIVAIRFDDEGLQMPPKKKLAAQQIADIEAWVKMGAPYPAAASAAMSASPTTHPHALTVEEGRRFWSLQPVREPALPATAHTTWPRNEIDRFILAKLSENALIPAPPANRRALLRRASFDLVGLPPTAKEVDEFEADSSGGAFEKVVDRLLASAQYGERWGRYWLDVARYADTKGYVFEEERRYAFSYTYRDWVVRALNEDLPYDQFLIQQIAADRLTLGEDKRPLAALGFLTLGRRFLNVQADIIDDRIDVVTRGTMALTVGCARCHDHKYDPIPTADYYSLYGVFASSREPAELPLLGGQKPAESAAFETELAKQQAGIDAFYKAKQLEHVAELRSAKSIAQYLLAAQKKIVTTAGKTPAGEEFETIDDGKSLNGFVLQRWQDYLNAAATRNDPVFATWRAAAAKSTTRPANANPLVEAALAGAKSLTEISQRYGEVLSKQQWLGAQSTAAQRELRQVFLAQGGPTSFNLEDSKVLLNRVDIAKHNELKQAMDSLIVNHPGSPPRAMAMEDLPQPAEPHIFVRGNSGNVGKQVPRQFPAVLSPEKRQPFKDGSGRLELAKLIASKDNPLTARVMVNRVWLHHFGAGLVRTPSDFGTRGDKPTHPELLDWLARRFVEDGWSIKKLHKRIMLSAAYQQASDDINPQARKVDPENRLLWRANPRRLDFEAMRDSLLAASAQLDPTVGGRSVDILAQPFVPRRTLYGFVDRQNLPGLYRTFDFASPDTTSAQRFDTSVPQQALFMMNSPFVIEQARKLAGRAEIASEPDPRLRVQSVYRIALQRNPTVAEVDLALRFIDGEEQQPAVAGAAPSPWLYGYGEFDEATQRLKQFHRFKHFTGMAWQGGPELPDPKTGWAMLNAAGGHPGNDAQHAVVRRWVARQDCTIAISGTVAHLKGEGDGIRARIVTPGDGVVASWTLLKREAATSISALTLKQGQTIDFIVDCRSSPSFDAFTWKIHLTKQAPANAVAGDDAGGEWDAELQFEGGAKGLAPLSPWQKYVQVLLQANEFAFVE